LNLAALRPLPYTHEPHSDAPFAGMFAPSPFMLHRSPI